MKLVLTGLSRSSCVLSGVVAALILFALAAAITVAVGLHRRPASGRARHQPARHRAGGADVAPAGSGRPRARRHRPGHGPARLARRSNCARSWARRRPIWNWSRAFPDCRMPTGWWSPAPGGGNHYTGRNGHRRRTRWRTALLPAMQAATPRPLHQRAHRRPRHAKRATVLVLRRISAPDGSFLGMLAAGGAAELSAGVLCRHRPAARHRGDRDSPRRSDPHRLRPRARDGCGR